VVLAVFILQFLSTGLNLVFQSSGSNFLKDFGWGATLLIVLAIGGRRYFWTTRVLPLVRYKQAPPSVKPSH
jgi:hypothetical protein